MRKLVPSKMLAKDTVLAAQQRAIAVRKKASFGNSSSGYEFGGWKSLFEGSTKSTKQNFERPLTNLQKPESSFNKTTKKSPKTSETTLCPSSQPDKDDALVFGVIEGTVESPRIAYLERSQPIESITPAIEVKPTEMLRIASPCQEKTCSHFDGTNCRLAAKIVDRLPAVTEALPPCQIRSDCRWWQQEGKSACLRCPQVVTENYYASALLEQVADPQVSPADRSFY